MIYVSEAGISPASLPYEGNILQLNYSDFLYSFLKEEITYWINRADQKI